MDKKFIEENKDLFASDMTDEEIMVVVTHIVKMSSIDALKRCWIQQFLLNWISVGAVASFKEA